MNAPLRKSTPYMFYGQTSLCETCQPGAGQDRHPDNDVFT